MTKEKSDGRSFDPLARPQFDQRMPIRTVPSGSLPATKSDGDWLLEYTAKIEREEAQRVEAEAKEKAKQLEVKVEKKIPPPLSRRKLATTKKNGGSAVKTVRIKTQPSQKKREILPPQEHPALATFWPFLSSSLSSTTHDEPEDAEIEGIPSEPSSQPAEIPKEPIRSAPQSVHIDNNTESRLAIDELTEKVRMYEDVIGSLLALVREAEKSHTSFVKRVNEHLLFIEKVREEHIDTAPALTPEIGSSEVGNQSLMQSQTISIKQINRLCSHVIFIGHEMVLPNHMARLLEMIVRADGEDVSVEIIASKFGLKRASAYAKVWYLVNALNDRVPGLGFCIKNRHQKGYYFERHIDF